VQLQMLAFVYWRSAELTVSSDCEWTGKVHLAGRLSLLQLLLIPVIVRLKNKSL